MSQTLELVDPKTLIVDANVRADADLTKEFVANVKANGVLQAITAYRDAEGALRVLYGQRRTLAAVEAGLTAMPVYVADSLEEADRIGTQVAENDQRRALTDHDRAEAFHQMALLGVSAAQIARKAGAEKGTVERAIKARKNDTATAALGAGRTLDQALVLAEFEDDAEATAELESVIADEPDQLDHLAQRLRNNRAIAARLAEAKAEAEAQGLTVVARIGYDASDEALPLRYLVDAEGSQPAEDAANAVALRLYQTDGEISREPGIVGWKELGYRYKSPYGEVRQSGPMTEEQKAERKTLIANNKAMDAAQAVRREWVRTLLARKSAPKGWQRFLAVAHTRHHNVIRDRSADLAAELAGVAKEKDYLSAALTEHVAAHPGRPEVALLALALAGLEENVDRQAWRRPGNGARFYLSQLAEWGYPLSDVERIITDDAKPSDQGEEDAAAEDEDAEPEDAA
ncbi:ParB N-terminal domain-containing protein [Sinomonas sp. JGH33]|uniref:ParB N-terminal domain-containing protein n=1 Tax=Sinomonas terricola TaxID=3110330 RepID=A0ABU5TBL6_9MICC|nr:ParB N-terminal domain-containing protein [Sinomonas sp. JGH33]MEA5456927.1 ParB N-terminal domain-containing protein [Sinomonas sp. JGH33]